MNAMDGGGENATSDEGEKDNGGRRLCSSVVVGEIAVVVVRGDSSHRSRVLCYGLSCGERGG